MLKGGSGVRPDTALPAMNDERELVFVYGTLRAGASNHFRMAGAEFVGKAWVRGMLFRVDWYPGLVIDEEARPVRGELYRVPPELLAALDDFEGAAGRTDDEFVRVYAKVDSTGSSEGLSAWVWEYRGPCAGLDSVPNDDWLECE